MNWLRQSRFLRLMEQEMGASLLPLTALAILAGLTHAAVVMLINAGTELVDLGRPPWIHLAAFLVTMAIFVATRDLVVRRCAHFMTHSILALRTRVIEHVRAAEVLSVERAAKSDLIAALNRGTRKAENSAFAVFHALTHVFMLAFSMLYMAYLSVSAALISLAVFYVCARQYLRIQKQIKRLVTHAATREDAYFAQVQHLLDGVKEIRLNPRRGEAINARLEPLSKEAAGLRLRAILPEIEGTILAEAFFFIILAAVLFALPTFSTDDPHLAWRLAELTALLLFMRGTMESILKAVPALAEADATLERLDELAEGYKCDERPAHHAQVRRVERQERVETVTARGLRYTYQDRAGGRVFSIGPIDMEIRAGEVTLIHGANGAGKTTLLKLLAGLYEPEAGELFLNDMPVGPGNRAAYRERVSAIFSDFHVFPKLYGLDAIPNERVLDLLNDLDLGDRTDFRERTFTNINLSTGQRKRLALLVSELEERPIRLYDEVAADQDPAFRRHYYEALLPRLKDAGRAVVVVSHDHRFFPVADRRYRMDCGRLVLEN